jgi:hypothetical protein
MDGWAEKDWDGITEAGDDLLAVVRELDNAVGGGGGGFEPAELAQFAERLQTTADRLKRISGAYL